jgi:hypothetical protein
MSLRDRILALFRKPVKDPRPVGPEHYYRQYWRKG